MRVALLLVSAFGLLGLTRAGSWAPWQTWTACSKSCGTGTRLRSRICRSASIGESPGCPKGSVDKLEAETCTVTTCPIGECGGIYSAQEAVIESPGYPTSSTPANVNCTWVIQAKEGEYIELLPKKFSMQEINGNCNANHLEILGLVYPISSFCGDNFFPNYPYDSSSNTLTLNMVSTALNEGFEIHYNFKVKPNCQKDFCYNEGTCSGVDTCNCANGYLEYRCAYVGYHPQTTPVVASGNYNIPMGTCTYTRGLIQKFSQSPRLFLRSCQFVLTKTSDQLARGAFEVLIKRHDTCPVDSGSCLEQITITSDITVTIKHNYAVEINGKPASLPINMYGMQVTEKKWTIFVALSDLYVVIDKKDFTVFVAANNILSGKLEGLCGDIGQSEADNNVNPVDLTWQKNPVDTACTSVTTPKTFCGNESQIEKFIADYNEQYGVGPSTREILRHRESIVARDSICNVLDTTAFEDCRANISVVSYRAECLDALCQCGMDKVDSCHCSAVAKYARDCTLAGFEVGNWRTPTSCGRTCPGNQIYKDCGSGCLATCDTLDTAYCERQCIDGCQCPEATFWSGKSCVAQEACPCTHAKVQYAPGATINDGCTKRTCMGATWQNEKLDCAGVAVASSFSHYRTLDGTWYDFPGSTCSYLLAEDCGSVTPSFSVFVEVQECGRNPNPCIRNIKILHKVSSTKTYTVVLKEGKVLSETKVVVLPVTNGAITVHKLSSLYVEAVIADTGVSILWDGATARLSVPTAYKGKICGLAGTYNSRTTDDFRTRGGLDETTLGFGNSYKYPALCDDVTDAMAASDMCNHDAQAEVKAATDCGIMNGKLFEACRNVVEYLPFYKNCRKDACACEADKKCYCEAVNDFAQACRQAGVVVDWRSNATCPNLCPTGQVYMTNGTLCGRTCRSLMETEVCSPSQMVEGCGCHEGQYLDKDNKCVDINQCGCYVNNDWQLANHQSEPTKNVQCICEKGVLKCNRKDELTAEAINCTSGMTRRDCSNPMEKGVECAPVCGFLDRTCPITQCIPGCVCEGGLVRNGDNCINASECPCFHNNQEYQVGEAVTEGCKTMTCMPRSVWKVSNQSCYRQCRVAAGAYITTFDMKRYDFRGTCKYLLASDSCKTGENFLYRITMQSKDCQGSNQAMCQSTIHIIAGVQELTLTSNQTEKPQPTVIHSRTLETKNILFTGAITTVDIGDYRVVDLKNGIKITWDRKASVYIEIKKTVEKSTCGLCGLQNGDAADDFTTATNNLVTSAVDFGNSWKVDSCPDVVESVTPTCDPKKRKWAESQCAVLRSSQFKECNENVDVTYFYEKCIRETCTCDTGGDCSCFCDSVADYAKLCGEMSIAVKWRSADLCPRMCQANNVNDDQCVWKYKPCVPCTTFCCDVSPVCLGGCYEGCYPDCPEGTQYNSKSGTCVPKEKCDCLKPTLEPPECGEEYEMVCKYNKWVNTHYSSEEKGGDFESSENVAKAIGACGYYTGIKCRSLNNPLAPLPAGVTCDVITGLSCTNTPNNTCDDYEVSLECCDCVLPNCTVTCKEEPTCQPHQNKTLVNETACCKEYSCECIGCYTGGELRDPESSWRENCTDYTCVSDGAGCYKVNALPITCPEKSCPTYASLETTDTGECCPTKTCVCEQDFTPERVATINCTAPEVLKVTDLVNGSLKCQRGECVCPGEKNMTNQHCVNSTSCPAPGCNIKNTHACGCPIESTCACDPKICPEPLPCDPCQKTVTVPAEPDKSDAYRCEHETCCSRVECEPVDCTNVAKPTCQDYEEVKEYPATGDECCPSYNCSCNETQCAASKPECGIPEEIFTDGMLNPCCANRTCVCTKCLDAEENLRAINETWKSSECVTQICLEQESGCPLVKLYQDDSVCTKEVCATGQTSLPNTKSSTPCCNATCCVSDCYDQGQSYSAGSTWKAGTCMTKSCQCSCDGDCEIVEHPKYCTNSQKTCAIGQSRVDIPNPDDPCCPNVECQCACVAYGDPHYMTFDSRPYSFMGQCQYTLVTYRTAPSRLHIYSENEVCSTSPSGPLTCLKKVFVRWDYTTVELYQADGISLSNSVFVNGSSVTLMWSGAGMTISMADSKVNLRIPEINLNLFYVTLATSPFVVIMIPVSTMFNKTVGLCGTCSADKQDDFEGSNKTIIDDVNDFGHSWRINECKKPNVTDCAALIGEGVTPLPSVCGNQTCEEDVCDLLTSSLFEKCQTISTAKDHRDNCIFDANRTKVCSICNSSAASSYAELCEMNGICVDWRKAANCSEPTCSAANTQYTACASQCQVTKTCGNYETLDRTCQSTKQVSGCFCKEGYVLRHSESTECIKTDCCSCSADPDCKPPKVLSVVPGTESNCCPTKQCVCPGQNDTQYNCKAEEDYNCNNDQHATEVLSTNPCCKNYTCSCNESPNPKEPNCNYPGQEVNESRSESDCYSTFNCICGTNMTKLEKDCPGYHETKAKCTKPDMKVSINQPAGYNSSNPCCPSYQCVCDTCAEKNITCMEGYEEKDLKTEGDCCSNWTCVCNSCKMENGTYIPIGTVYDETSDQCRLSKTCSKNRVSASVDSCRLIKTTYNENTTCTTLQSFEDKNCIKKGEIAVEKGKVGCCMTYRCVCNTSGTSPPLECPHPGEEAQEYNIETSCYPQYNCTCSTDMENLKNLCSDYQETKAKCTKSDMEVVVDKVAGYNASDPCCPSYKCVCQECKVGNQSCKTGYSKVDVKNEEDCCSNWTCACNGCINSTNHIISRGDTFTEAKSNGCMETKTCSSIKTDVNDVTSCYSIETIHDTEDNCQPLEEYETKSCLANIEHAVKTEKPPGQCCDDFQCVCNNDTMLSKHCDYWTNYNCSVKGMIRVRTNPDDQCCPQYKCVCPSCPETNQTCDKQSWSPKVIDNDEYPKECGCKSTVCECDSSKCETEFPQSTCSQVWYTKNVVNETFYEGCCPKIECICNRSACNQTDGIDSCSLYQDTVETTADNKCCPRTFQCKCKNETELNKLCLRSDNTTNIPLGHEKVFQPNLETGQTSCCSNYTIECRYCITADKELKSPGSRWTSKDGNCQVDNFCTSERLSNLGCYKINKTTEVCQSKDEYQESNCNVLEGELAYEVDDPTSCCQKYTCECNKTMSAETKPSCTYPGENLTLAEETKCHKNYSCLCSNDMKELENLCSGYQETKATCTKPDMKVSINQPAGYNSSNPCCPSYQCVCDTCAEKNITCKKGYEEKDLKTEGDCCSNWTCVCNSCKMENGTYIPIGTVYDETSDQCRLSKTCSKNRVSASVDSCRLIMTTYNENTTCTTLQSFQENNCVKEGEIAVENGRVGCCMTYRCVCNTSGTSPPLECPHPGEEAQEYNIETSCYPQYNCTCSTDMENLKNLCSDYQETKAKCTKPDMEVVVDKVAGYNASDPCCPSYKCVCQECKVGNQSCKTGYSKVDVKNEEDCCSNWTCACNGCINSTNHIISRGDTFTEAKSNGCMETKTCSSIKTDVNDVTSCYSIKTTHDTEDNCQPLKEYETKSCLANIEHAVKTEKPPGQCCDDFQCVCNNDTMLSKHCDYWTNYNCSRKGMIRVRTNPDDQCCPQYKCVCRSCPETNQTCDKQSWSPKVIDNEEYPEECGCKSTVCECDSSKCETEFPQSTCSQVWYTKNVVNETFYEGCCPKIECICNRSACNQTDGIDSCSLYQDTVETTADNKCCPRTFQCKCKNETELNKLCLRSDNTTNIPLGHEKVFQPNLETGQTSCCSNYTIECRYCITADKELKSPGSRWTSKDGNCQVDNFCTSERLSNLGCYKINKTTEVCQSKDEYQESNCNVLEGELAYEVDDPTSCCQKYTCECNKTMSAETKPSCTYPGENLTLAEETKCHKNYTCLCSNDMKELENLCSGYQETKATCTKPDMKVSINQPAGYNSSNPCCPSYQCVCDTCAEKNITCMEGYEEKDLKTEGDCCSNWTCVCNSCKMENGTYIPIGTVYDETSDQCRLSKTCSKNRVSASVDSCRLIETTYNENTTCTTLQSFEDKNCIKKGEIAVEKGKVGCCMTYRCVCNTSGTSPPRICQHPGEEVQEYNIETSCYPQYNCTCSTDMENLKNLCSDYQETKAKCTKPDMEVVVDKVAGYNASDPCCPSYKCVCQECKVGNQSCKTGYSKVDVKNEEDCCSNWTCACNGCINSTNHIISRGDTFTEAKSNGCMETKTCSSIKTDVNDVTSCYSIETIHDTEDNCQPLEEYETKSCLANIEHAVKTEKPPGQCCDDFQCVCNNDTMLSKHCDYWTNYNCSVKGMIRVRTNPDDQCCPQYKCVCPSCPETNQTCDKQSWSPKVIDNDEYPKECGCKSTVCECDSSKCETEFPQSTCSQVWYTKNVVNETFYEGCCPKIECICNRSACNQTDGIDSCSLYQDTVETTADNKCCPRTFQCKCKNETELNKLCLRSDNTTNIPLGHEKVFQPNLETGQTSCCSNYTIECRYCITADKELKSPGSRWTSKDGNCQVDNFCTSERLSNLGCYKINKTTEVCQSKDEYQESNCNVLEGELAYEVDDPTSCCQKYTCECNKTMSAETKPSCTYPGENLTLAEETKCHKNYTCLCSNDMKELENLCSGYQETKATCTKPNMKVSINQPAGYNSSNPCCPSYQCVCDTCAEKNITCIEGYEEKDLKTEGDCCSSWTCVCNSCKMENGTYIPIGTVYDETSDQCHLSKTCSKNRVSASDDSCRLIMTIFNENTTCTTLQSFQDNNCVKEGEIAVENGRVGCCMTYRCVCNTSGTSPPYKCLHPGEKAQEYNIETSCYPQYNCTCSTDMENLKNLCSDYQETKAKCTKPDMEVVVDKVAGYNASDPCCPSYKCVCQECKVGNQSCETGYSKVDVKNEEDCCSNWTCACNGCINSTNHIISRGDTFTEAKSNGCMETKTCSSIKTDVNDVTSCYSIETIHDTEDNCQPLEEYETKSCLANIEHAVKTEKPPGQCCDDFQCVCNNDTMLSKHCDYWTNYNCSVKGMIRVRTNPDDQCCPQYKCVCPSCPETNQTCDKQSWSPKVIDNDEYPKECGCKSTVCECDSSKCETEFPQSTCSQVWYTKNVVNETFYEGCCPKIECICNRSACNQTDGIDSCSLYQDTVETTADNKCCPRTFQCKCKNETELNKLCLRSDNTTNIPLGHEKVFQPNLETGQTSCCSNYTIECRYCITADKELKSPGSRWTSKDGNCQVDNFCTSERLSNLGCYKINKTTEVCQSKDEYQESKCNVLEGELAYEVDDPTSCCQKYTCECNKTMSAETKPSCTYPGENLTLAEETKCHKNYTCLCSNDMKELKNLCSGYQETKATCTKPDMKVSINQPAGYNSSNPCCPSYQCVCDTCAEKNITCMEGYEEKDLKTEGDCCSNWTCVCNSCKMENGTYIPIGTVYDETSDQCRLSKTCSKNRVSASVDSCRLIMTTYIENTTCTTLQSFEDKNCIKKGEIAVEKGKVGCCMTYRCVCNTSGTSPPRICQHPGEEVQEYNIETSCYPQYNCTCSTDMENLKNLCSDYQETKAKCTKPDMEVVVDKVAGYNASDPCCPSYKCVCQECKVGNQSCETGYSNVDVKNEEDCCSNWTCACNGCINSTNHIISRGDTFTEAKSNGCMETKTCSSIKTDVNDVTSCYSIETIHDTEDNCQPLEEYETKSCLANIEHAVKTEKPPGQCCDDFQCVCNNDTMLSKHCDYWTNYNCSRKGMIRVRTNPDDQCCPQYKCVCRSCPETNQTCDKQSWSPKVIDNEEYSKECGCKSTVCECDSSKCETEFPQSTCSQVWYTKNVVNETFYEGCCPKIECICNRSACNQTDGIDSCSLYQDTVETTADNTCCPRTFQCKCKNETELNKLCLRSDNTTNIPLGHEKVFQPNLETGQTSCCSNYTIECRYCITAYKELKSPGSRWTSKDGNCQVDNFCTSERLSNLGCYKINKTTEVCQSKDEYQESNCNVLEGELAYEVDDPTSCCQKYTCECNKTMSAETKPSCTYPGENLTLAEETKCHKNYTCLCSNDMKELENLCSGYQETKATCTKPDMKVSINQPAGYNSSNPCCPSYQCVCDTCAEKNITCKKGYEEKDLKTEGDCCSNWTCNCNSCKLANGSLVAVGEQYQELDPSGCPEKKICSAQKISSDPLSCHLPDTIWAEKDNCDTASNFEAKYCNKTGQYAVDTGNGACCTEYKCVCKAKDTSICSYSGEVRKDVAESPTSCPSSACVCANDTEYYKSVCANFIFIFCNNPLKEIVEVDGTWGGPCCPNVECRCKECTEPTVENCPKGYLLSVIKDECDCNKTSCECNSCEDTNSELHEIGSTWGMADSVGCIQQYDCSPTAKRYDNGRKCLIPSPIVKNCSKPNCNTCQKAEEVSYNATHPDPDLCCTEYLCVNQTCETAEQYKDKNCNPDQIVEVNSTTECCPKHACVCPDKKLPTCKHPGEVAKLISDGTSCPYYNCTCGADMAKLPNLCPAYNETLDVCNKPDMMVTVDQSAGQNASNPCCPSYKCICKTCKPANVTSCDPGYVLRNLAAQGDCCANNTCSCDSCFTANGTRLERGQTYNVTDSQHCSVTKVCSSRRVDESDEISCYVIDTNYKQIEHCTKLSDFESNYCQAGYQHAEALTVTNQCCDEFQCVCNNATMLLDVCEKSNVTLVQCKEAGRENMTYVTTGECCQKLHCPCLKGSELDAQCPGSDLSCDYSEHKQLNFTDGLCCPTYSCTCKPCPINHMEKPDRLPAIYEKYVALNTSENPLQKCCPKYKIVCGDTGKCPKPNCTGNTTMVQTDATMPGTRDCCPLHVCRCDVCELTSGYMVALHDTWKEDIGGGCNVTRMCSEERTTLGDMESCHVIKNLTDPTLRCKSITEYEHELCSSVYLRAVPYEEVPDTDPCCSGYRCQCKNAARLSALCPPDEVATCGNYTHKEMDGFMANTSDCCPLRKCVCDDESILKTSCDQWDDFTCPLGEERIQLEQRNSKTGPCCPKYRCQCMNNAMLQSVCAQWNVTCAIGLRRVRTNALSECCPEFECVCDKCVQNEIAFPIGSSIRNDSCYASSCVRNTTTKCPQIVSYNKYECEPINQTCVERGGRILANLSTSGCCKYCEESPYPCAVGTRNVILNATVEGHRCWTNKAYDINYCSGSCPTTQHINPTSGLIAGKCKCCKPAFTASRNYDMVCDDATPRKHSQLTILSCTCKDTTCEEAAAEKVVVPAK